MPRLTLARALILTVMLAGIAALTACSVMPAAETSPEAGPTTAELSIRPVLPELAGTRWLVEAMGGVAVIAGSEPRIIFARDGAVNGTTGCNRFFGQYIQDGPVLRVSNIGMTKMACMGRGVMQQESAFAEILEGTNHIRANAAGEITLHGEVGGGLVARRLPAEGGSAGHDPALLTGAEWHVADLNRGGVIDGSHLTLTFGPNGRVSGSAHCNNLSGIYDATRTVITFGPISTTLMACVNEAMGQQELIYTEALRGDMDWHLTQDGALELTREGGHRILLRR